MSIASGERPNRAWEHTTAQDFSDQDGELSPTDTINEDSNVEPEELSEAEELFQSLKDTISGLFRLAMIIRKSSPRNRFEKALSGRHTFEESFDVAHVGHKFPKLDQERNSWLRNRLGKAITQRRRYLQYAREHRQKLERGSELHWRPTENTLKPTGLPLRDANLLRSEADRTENTTRPSTLAPTTASTVLLPNEPIHDVDFQDDQSQTSYALSLGDGSDESQLQLPSLVEISKGSTAFECPFCWTIQSFRKESAWRKHMFTDLRPYVCTFEDCDVKIFANRRDWFEHELQRHRQHFACHFCQKGHFSTLTDYRQHLAKRHLPSVDKDQLDAVAQAGAQPVTGILASECPFCDDWQALLCAANPGLSTSNLTVTPTKFRQHVGSHMDNLALFAIPRGHFEDEEPGTASTTSIRVAGDSTDRPSSHASLPEGVWSVQTFQSAATARIDARSNTNSEVLIRNYITKIQRAWRRHKLHQIIKRKSWPNYAGEQRRDIATFVHCAWPGRITDCVKLNLINKWTRVCGVDPIQFAWHNHLSTFPLFFYVSSLLESMKPYLEWSVIDAGMSVLVRGKATDQMYWLIEGAISVFPYPPWGTGDPQTGLLNLSRNDTEPYEVKTEATSFVAHLPKSLWNHKLEHLHHYYNVRAYLLDYGDPIPFYLEQNGSDWTAVKMKEYELWKELHICVTPEDRARAARRWLSTGITIFQACEIRDSYSPLLNLAARLGDTVLLTILLDLGGSVDREDQDRSLKNIAARHGQSAFVLWIDEQFSNRYSEPGENNKHEVSIQTEPEENRDQDYPEEPFYEGGLEEEQIAMLRKSYEHSEKTRITDRQQDVPSAEPRGPFFTTVSAILIAWRWRRNCLQNRLCRALRDPDASNQHEIAQKFLDDFSPGVASGILRTRDTWKNALLMAARRCNFKLGLILVNRGADVDAVMSDGSTPLEVAWTSNSLSFAFWLLDQGARNCGRLGKDARDDMFIRYSKISAPMFLDADGKLDYETLKHVLISKAMNETDHLEDVL